MANEAKEVELYGANNSGDKRRYTCADTPAITKGTLLMLTDPRTASAHTGIGDKFCGIASMDKEASDGSTSISAWTNGIFEMTTSGTILAGTKVTTTTPVNSVAMATSAQLASSYAIIVGTALEDADSGEVINVRVLI